MNIEITPRSVLAVLLFLIAFLLLANLASVVFELYGEFDDVYKLTNLFNFGSEKNISTLYSSFALVLCAALLAVIAVAHKRLGASCLPWFGLAVVFLYLAIDEGASLHERLTLPLRESLDTSGVLYFAWIIPYSAAMGLLAMLYFRFLSGLPRQIMVLFLVSGLTYISGAIGLEMVGGLWADLHGNKDLIYSLIVTCEEFLEMLGIVIFIYALVLYIAEHFEKLTITTARG